MTTTIRFPLLQGGPAGPTEADQVITLLSAVASLQQGGATVYAPLTPWKIDANLSESPFPCVVIEFEGNNNFTIGNGTTAIGLYGEINLPGGSTFKTLLGILGTNFASTNVPQIILDQVGGAGAFVGYSQVISNVACYDALSVGGVGAAITFSEGDTVTVRARPIRQRSWMG